MIHIIFLLFLLLVILINFVALYLSHGIGILINSFSILLLAILAAYDLYDFYAQDILSLTITFIMVNLITCYLHISDIYTNSLLIYIVVCFVSLIFCFKIFHEKKLFRLKNLKHIYIIGIGPIIGAALYYFHPFHQFLPLHITSMQAISLIILMGITEAIFFQALIQNAVTAMTDSVIAIFLTSILYGLFHFNNNIAYVALFIGLNFLYSIVYAIGKNIYMIIGLSIAINLTFYLLTAKLLLFATTIR